MHTTLTAEQHFMLEVIADHPLAATPEIARYTVVLAAVRLIELTPVGKWQVTGLGKAVLERDEHSLH
jgi:hypothetical protein